MFEQYNVFFTHGKQGNYKGKGELKVKISEYCRRKEDRKATGGMISEQRRWEMKQDEMKHLQTLGEMMRGERRGRKDSSHCEEQEEEEEEEEDLLFSVLCVDKAGQEGSVPVRTSKLHSLCQSHYRCIVLHQPLLLAPVFIISTPLSQDP